MASLAVGNHGDGAQSSHTGSGGQSVNTGPGIISSAPIGNYIANLSINSSETLGTMKALFGGMTLANPAPEPTAVDILKWLKSLSPVDFQFRRDSLLNQRVPGTGLWLLSDPAFESWKVGQQPSTLWLDGIIGSGKSVLAAIITEQLEKEINLARDNKALIYICFGLPDADEGPTMEGLFVNILMQLRRTGEFSTEVVQAFKGSRVHETRPSVQHLEELICAEMKGFATVFLVIDALDNCSNDTTTGIREPVIKFIKQLPENCKTLVTSRSGTSTWMERHFQKTLKMRVEAKRVDVESYIDSCINTNADFLDRVKETAGKEVDLRHEIYNTVINKAQGIFLLVEMHMHRLLPAGQGTVSDIRAALGELPKGRTATFDTALQRIRKQPEIQSRWAKLVISWVLSARRPLTTNEARYAFAVDRETNPFDLERVPKEDQLISACDGLIVVFQDDNNIKTLRPVHDSVISCFESFELIPPPGQRHLDMALRCITYLRHVPSSAVPVSERISRHPLIKYAAIHWFYHAMHAESTDTLQRFIIEFLHDTPRLSASFQVRDSDFPNSITGLHAAAFFNMTPWIEQLLVNNVKSIPEFINAPCSDGQTPLHWAAKLDRCSLAELLITSHGADVDALDKSNQTPLHLAVEGNHERMVQLLLKHKAKPNVRSRKGLTPFVYAIKNRRFAAVRALAENKVEMDAEDTNHGTPLTWAMHYMNLEIMGLLLDNGWDVNWQKSDGWTALRSAAEYGSEPMTRLLLKHKAKVDLCDLLSRRTPLRWAVLYGHRTIAQILLEHGADLDSVCKDGETPLMQAARHGDSAIVWLLAERGASLDLQMKDGSTASHLAVYYGFKQIAWFLIERGALVSLQDNEGMTVLHLAICAGDPMLAWYLVERGADYRATDNRGRDCLLLAAQTGQIKIFQLLMERGAQWGSQDKRGLTALHHASERGHVEMVRGLVACGTKLIDAKEENGNSALHFASREGYSSIVEALVKAGADVNILNKDGSTALHLAIMGDDQAKWDEMEASKIMLQLINEKADPNIQDGCGRTALMYAARRGSEFATFHLIRPGIDADKSLRDNDQYTAKDHAANGKHEWTVKILSHDLSNGFGS